MSYLERNKGLWKAVPVIPTSKMLNEMDDCAKEGYDCRLLTGIAASVYGSAINAAPEYVGINQNHIYALKNAKNALENLVRELQSMQEGIELEPSFYIAYQAIDKIKEVLEIENE